MENMMGNEIYINKWLIIISIIFCSKLFAGGEKEIQYLFPLPDSKLLPKETVIIVRFNELLADDITNLDSFISVSGELSGSVNGQAKISSDNKTIIFKSEIPYIAGEVITVRMVPRQTGSQETILDSVFNFEISDNTDLSIKQFINTHNSVQPNLVEKQKNLKPSYGVDPIIRNGVSIPSDFPWVNITIKENPDSGFIFLNNWGGQPYNMILDNDGNPVWYLRTKDRRRDFKLQPDGRLTMLVREGYGGGSHIAFDSTYTVVDTFFAPPGYVTDEHDLQVLPNGHYLLIALDWQEWDLSDSVSGGNPNATVVGNNIVEMDANDNPVFIWRSWDHYNITDAVHENLTASYIDYMHMNAIEVDHDGNLLVSCRHMSEVTKINRQTGDVIWRLGGLNDDFGWDDQNRISYQHDIRVLPNGNYTIFDNGNYHAHFSRALELQVDTLSWLATKTWEFRDSPDKFTGWMGNVQRLPSGNTLINWADGSLPKITEVRPDGSKALELNFENNAHCYRVFKFPWQGKANKPYLFIESYSDRITLLFNKFGDKDILNYNIYGGLSPHPEQLIATSEESFIHLFELTNLATYYFRVTAVNSKGEESDFSNEEEIYVRIHPPGSNMITNGDFADGFTYWEFNVETSQASASHSINSEGELEINISDGGSEYWHIQALYPNLTLIEGEEYLFEFDAYSTQSRIIEAEIRKEGDPWTNYSRRGPTWITQVKNHFPWTFHMIDPTEFHARVILNVGGGESDVFIDNVSLKQIVTGVSSDKSDIPVGYFLEQNYPNPFNSKTIINYKLATTIIVELSVYNLLGQKVATLISQEQKAGSHQIEWNASQFSSGIYYYRIEAGEFQDVKKVILMK